MQGGSRLTASGGSTKEWLATVSRSAWNSRSSNSPDCGLSTAGSVTVFKIKLSVALAQGVREFTKTTNLESSMQSSRPQVSEQRCPTPSPQCDCWRSVSVCLEPSGPSQFDPYPLFLPDRWPCLPFLSGLAQRRRSKSAQLPSSGLTPSATAWGH